MSSQLVTALTSEIATVLASTGGVSVAALAIIYSIAALISGFSGFGFSAIGALSFAVLPPAEAVTVLVSLSLLTQLSSILNIWGEMRAARPSPFHPTAGVLPSVVGGAIGLPIGISLLKLWGAPSLMLAIGSFLLVYTTWAVFGKVQISARYDNPVSSSIVGICGGVVGGVCGFPGSAMVVWNGLIGRGKAGRAYTQSFVLLSQVIAIAYLSTAHLFGGHTLALLFVFAPVALIANTVGVKLYKSASAERYKTVTLAALGISGLGLIAKVLLLP